MLKDRVFSLIGLGYVGLPLAAALARRGARVIGFDINEKRIQALADGHDASGEVDDAELATLAITFTTDPERLREADFHIVAVPTPIDDARRPDLGPLCAASRTVGARLKPGDIVVYESTVYPGCTREEMGPILQEVSGLPLSAPGGFGLGYSPERINPGEKTRPIESIVKVVSGCSPETTHIIAEAYRGVIDAGVHVAPTIEVAEAAKVIENTQRDVNIALMNEFALIFDRLGISTNDVLAAARTKWNFLNFTPGLVGGHCIGVDPYYLTTRAEKTGYRPEVILSGRRINDSMGGFIALKGLKLMARTAVSMSHARVGVLGVAFKENVADFRNSRTPDVVAQLADYGVTAMVHDPHVDPAALQVEHGLTMRPLSAFQDLDMLILAAPHAAYFEEGSEALVARVKEGGVILDVKGKIDRAAVGPGQTIWSL